MEHQNTSKDRRDNFTNQIGDLRAQIEKANDLRHLAFDNPYYGEWRSKTGQLLAELFGRLDSDEHPCTKAFLDYRIPQCYTADRSEMQEYYKNILRNQIDLLKMYLEDFEESHT